MTGNIGSKHMLHLPQPTPIQPSSDMTTKTKKQQLTKTHGGQGRTQLQRLRTERRPVTTQERSTLNGPMESAVDQQHKKTLPSKTHNPTHVPTDYTTSGTQRSALSINMSTTTLLEHLHIDLPRLPPTFKLNISRDYLDW